MAVEPAPRRASAGRRRRRLGLKILAACLSLSASLVFAEVALRIYNPYPSRVRGGRIVLKANLSQQVNLPPGLVGMDPSIVYSQNSLGLRGEEPPANWSEHFTIVTVGGSTTECSLITDQKTWPYQLGKLLEEYDSRIWLNNAGIDGHSSVGHLVLLDDYLLELKPNMIVFLMGINDRARGDQPEAGLLVNRDESVFRRLAKRSEVLLLVSNLVRASQARNAGLTHGSPMGRPVDPSTWPTADAVREEHQVHLRQFRGRVLALAERCRSHGILPVFATQSLRRTPEDESPGVVTMEVYNDVVREVARDERILLVDLWKQLDLSPENYYDGMHYTNLGCAKVAKIMSAELLKGAPQLRGLEAGAEARPVTLPR